MDTAENRDDHMYSWVMLTRETVEFVIRAIDFYLSLLGDESKELAEDPDLMALITDDVRRELGTGRDKERSERVRQWLQHELVERPNSYDVTVSLSHWSARFMKSVSLLYLAKLRKKRNAMASRPNVTAATLSAVDREITSKEELFLSAGIFKNASPLQLLAEYENTGELSSISAASAETLHTPSPTNAGSDEIPLLAHSRPRQIIVGSIELLDHELRTRCLDLFNTFQESGQPERYDTVVSEASRILENRLRTVTGCSDGSSAKHLVTLAFNGDTPRLKVSAVRAEQEAAQLLFLGTFGFIRNQVQHKLLGNLPAERTLQVIGWIDYLLSVIAQAEPATDPPSDSSTAH